MGLFGKSNKDGGILNVIRCDETDYLVWKWRPNGVSTGRENSIRWGSSLRVKEGEVAVFVYSQSDGKQMDFFEGPLDTTLKTANFPVLSSIIGSAFGGDTPFQAEIYFINISGNIKIPFFVNTFDLFDPRFPDFAVPTTVQGQMLINVSKYKEFTRLHRMIDFELEELYGELRATLYRHIKSVITSASFQANIPVIQIERCIDIVNDAISNKLKPIIEDDFGVNLKRIDISDITIDKESQGYINLFEVTARQVAEVTQARTEDTVERMRMGRDIDFKRQNLSAETDYFAAHQLNRQADVAEIAAESLGQLGGSMDGGGGGGFNPAGMMAGMMLGTAVGQNVAGTLNNTMQSMQMGGTMQGGMMQGGAMAGNPMQGQAATPPPMPGAVPPPLPQLNLFVAVNGQQAGPFDMTVIQQMVYARTLTPDTLVWKQGMAAWAPASTVAELVSLFSNLPPQL